MPTGKRYSKKERKWVDIERERPIDYKNEEMYDSESWGLLISFMRAYPDWLLDLMQSPNSRYELELIQRVNIRAFCTMETVDITGSRGTTKSFTVLLSALVFGILFPGTIKRYFGPTNKQAAEIASNLFKELQIQYPFLCEHWHVVSDSKENFELATDYGSVFSIASVPRGDNMHGVIAEEAAQQDGGAAFDHEKFRSSILPAVRLRRMVNREVDDTCPQFQKLTITSAGTQQNQAFEYRQTAFQDMVNGKSAFCIDYPAEVSVLSGIRSYSWYEDLKRKLTPEEWLREMCSIYTGTSENPVIRDTVLTESRNLYAMESRHCGDKECIYIVANDVSYIDSTANAKCATAVLKLEPGEKGKYTKSLVYIIDEPPPRESIVQAKKLKERWRHFCLEGSVTYIAIDAAAYGKAVLEDLHKDLGDGLPPLCCINHDCQDIELDGALPVIYPIRATPGFGGRHDPDSEMLRYAELEFEQYNVRLLTNNILEGVETYKRIHRIKDDSVDSSIALPYLKTRDLCGQIANLKKKPSGTGMQEVRISKSIQRDMWSALKYALRLAQILERQHLVDSIQRDNPWYAMFQQKTMQNGIHARVLARKGGNNR